MSTVNKDGMAHAKQCCFVKMGKLGKDNAFHARNSRQLEALRRAVDQFYDGATRVQLRDVSPPDLTRYLSKDVLFPQNTGHATTLVGPPG